MNVKKAVSVLLILLFVFALLPVQAFAQAGGQGTISGECSATMTQQLAATTTDDGPSLAEGNHERWIDRIASPPQYALDFYTWLEENGNTDGALADPTKGLLLTDTYVYRIHTLNDSAAFTYTGSGHKTAAENAVISDLGDAHMTVVNYAGAVYGAFDRDHPEVFWLSGNAIYGYSIGYDYTYFAGRGTVKYTVEIYFYLQSPDFDIRNPAYQSTELVSAAISQRDEAIASILADCPTTTDYDRIHYLNQVLTQTNCYNSAVAAGDMSSASADAWKAISALKGATGVDGPVCEGYARAFLLLCRALGYPCVLVEGPAKTTASGDTIAHMWNYVQLDGSWYAVDTTWNDPYSFSIPTTANSGMENAEWLLLGSNTQVTEDMTFIDSHAVTNYTTMDSLQYVNGPVLSTEAYTPVKPLVQPAIGLKYPSLSFEDVIIMNVYYSATNLEDVVEMGLITYSEKPEIHNVETAEHVVPGYGISEADGLYYSSTAGIAPKDIGDIIYFAVYAKLADGTYSYSMLINYSPKTYAMNMLKTSTAEMKTLVAAMLGYGAAAQNYFSYKTDTLVNADMTDEQKALVADYSADMIAAFDQPNATKAGALVNNGGHTNFYPTISFEGAFCINYYFLPKYTVSGDVTMYIWNLEDYEAAEVLSKDNATKAITMSLTESGEYLGVVDGIAAKDLDKAVYVSVCYSNGTTDYCYGVIGYTIGLYCKGQAAKTGTLADLAAACAVYGYYAKQLFG